MRFIVQDKVRRFRLDPAVNPGRVERHISVRISVKIVAPSVDIAMICKPTSSLESRPKSRAESK
jgi:hypothetical protein